jgi:hypothetical protein
MWVTNNPAVEVFSSFLPTPLFTFFTHSFSHRVKSLNSPLTWGYNVFPQVRRLVTTTTYNYLKALVRFPLINFFYCSIIKTKNLQSFTTAGRLTK